MRLIITDQASQAIIKELALQAGDGVRFFGKQVPGQPVNHDHKQGYAKDNHPVRPIIHVHKDAIDYHINFADAWFFSGLVVTVDYLQETEGPVFIFRREDNGGADVDAATGASRKYEEYWE